MNITSKNHTSNSYEVNKSWTQSDSLVKSLKNSKLATVAKDIIFAVIDYQRAGFKKGLSASYLAAQTGHSTRTIQRHVKALHDTHDWFTKINQQKVTGNTRACNMLHVDVKKLRDFVLGKASKVIKDNVIKRCNAVDKNKQKYETRVIRQNGVQLTTSKDLKSFNNRDCKKEPPIPVQEWESSRYSLLRRTFEVFNQNRAKPIRNLGRAMDTFRKLYRRDNISHMTNQFMIDRVSGFMNMHIEHTDYRRGYG